MGFARGMTLSWAGSRFRFSAFDLPVVVDTLRLMWLRSDDQNAGACLLRLPDGTTTWVFRGTAVEPTLAVEVCGIERMREWKTTRETLTLDCHPCHGRSAVWVT